MHAKNAKNLDQLAINTIRTLAMDAVQAANSGPPGTAMAMAPVVHSIWQHVLRFDPEDPIWPNRDRFVLPIGHASMLLYAVLNLCGVKAINAKYERLGQLSVNAGRHQAVSSARQQMPRPPRVSLDVRRGNDNRTARAGRGGQYRNGACREVDG